jgi:hypothetical protein
LTDLNFPAEDRHFSHKSSVLSKNFCPAGQDSSGTGTEPVAHRGDRTHRFEIMRSNVLARDVRNELLKSVLFAIENETGLLTLRRRSAAFDAKKHSQLQWHVESGKPIDAIEFCSRQIVDAKPAFFDDGKYLLNARLARIVNLESTSRMKSAHHNCEYNTIENWFEPSVEGAIDEGPDMVIDRALISVSTPHELP